MPTGVAINTAAGVTAANLPSNVSGVDGIPSTNAVVNQLSATSIQVLVTPANAETTLGFNLPLTVTSCPPAGAVLTATAVLASGSVPIENGTTTTTTITPSCVDGVSGVVASDEATSDTQVALGAYNTLVSPAGGVGPNGHILGTVNYTLAPTGSIDTAGTLISAGDIASIAFNVAFADASGIMGVWYAGNACTAPTMAMPNAFTCTASGAAVAAAVDGTADLIEVTAKGPTGTGATAAVNAIVNQAVSVSSPVVTFANANFVANEAGASGALDGLNRQGKTFGVFDWNGTPQAGGTNSVYRITGLTGPTNATVTTFNSISGMKSASYPFVLTPVSGNNDEAVLTSFTLGQTVGAAGDNIGDRYDFSLFLETNDPVDVDRLMIREGVVTAFNDGSNNSATGNTPNSDDDDAANE